MTPQMRQIVLLLVNINRIRARVTRLNIESWIERQSVSITWNPVHLGVESQKVAIQLARYSMRDDGHVFFHSMYTLIPEQLNTGQARFIVPRGKGTG